LRLGIGLATGLGKGNEADGEQHFINLGSDIDADGACGNEIRRRMGLSRAVVNGPCNACVLAVMTYSAESWTLTTQLELRR